jgi:hypothetical protein
MRTDRVPLRVSTLVSWVIAEVAPTEAGDQTLAVTGRPVGKKHPPLGGGVGLTAAQVLTPVISFVVGVVAESIVDELTTRARDRLARLVRRGFDRVCRRATPPRVIPVDPRWTENDLSHIRATALEQALALGLDPGQAELVADAIVGGLLRGGWQ